MQKNVSGQRIGAQLLTAADGSAFTGSVTVAVTVDAGTQATGSVGSGACTHEGGGYHTYAPAQAETNGDLIAFTFSGTGAVPVTVQVYTVPPNFNTVTIANNAVDADVELWKGSVPASLADTDKVPASVQHMASNVLTAAAAATDFGAEIQALITGGAYALSTDANGRTRIVDGTGTGELDTASGVVLARDHAGDALATAAAIAALNDLDAAGVRSAVGLASANLDTQLDALPTAAENATAAWAAGTRTLTALDEDSTTLDLDATIRAALGLSAANLDTQIAALPTQAEITGGAYPLDTDSNGRVRIVDGTGAGELDTTLGLVKISGTIQTLDALDTAQDAEHDATQALIAALNDLSSSDVQAAANAALVALDLDHLSKVTSGVPAAGSGTYIDQLLDAIALVATPDVDEEAIADAVLSGLGGQAVQIVSPLSEAGVLTLIKGDDYLETDGREIEFTATGITADFTGASVFLSLRSGRTAIEIEGDVVTGSSATRVVTFEIPTADSSDLTPTNEGKYDVRVVLSNGSIIRPWRGKLAVIAPVTVPES